MSKPSDLVQGTLDLLEHNGWIDAKWGESENKRRAKRLSAAIALVIRPT